MNNYVGRGFSMKPQRDNAIFSRIAIKTPAKEIGLAGESAAGANRLKTCPFTSERLADCYIRNSNGRGKVCPFSLETCLLPRDKTHGPF